MSQVLELRRKRGEIWDQAKAFLDSHRDESGLLSAEDTAQYERMEQDVVNIGHAIEREERVEAMERELNTPVRDELHGTTGSRKPGRETQHQGQSLSGRVLEAYARTAGRGAAQRPTDRHAHRRRIYRSGRIRAYAGGSAAGREYHAWSGACDHDIVWRPSVFRWSPAKARRAGWRKKPRSRNRMMRSGRSRSPRIRWAV